MTGLGAYAAQGKQHRTRGTSVKLNAAHNFFPYPLSFRGTAGGDPPSDTGGFYDGAYLVSPGAGSGTWGPKLRDRPPPADILTPGTSADDCFIHDQQVEVQRMIAGGFNGMFAECLSLQDPTDRNYYLVHRALVAAANYDPTFQVVLMPDMSASNYTQAQWVSAIADFASRPAAARTAAGDLLVAPYFPAWNKTPSFYQACAADLLTNHGIRVAWLWCFEDYNTEQAAFTAVANTYGVTIWGTRNPAAIISQRPYAVDAKARGLRWFQFVAYGDCRPASAIFDESNGTQALRECHITARLVDADGTQATTWNDYSECTALSASVANGTPGGWTQINALYLSWFVNGVAPTVGADFVALVHRKHHSAAATTGGQTTFMALRGGSTPTQDIVEVFTWLTAPATVTATIGGVVQAPYTAPAGEGVQTFPITTATAGAPSVTWARAGVDVGALTSRNAITTTPQWQDMAYYVTCTDLDIPSGGGFGTSFGESFGAS